MIFNPLEWDPSQGSGSLPVGTHLVVIDRHEAKPSQNNSGNGYLEVGLRIVDGPNAGISGPDRLNIYHDKQQTVEIALRRLSAYCHVVGYFGILNLPDITPLYGKQFKVEVQQQKENPQYTQVTRVLDINGQAPKASGSAPQQAQQPSGQGWGQQAGQAPQNQQSAPPAANNGGYAPTGQPQAPAQQSPSNGWQGQQAPPQQQAPQGGQQPWQQTQQVQASAGGMQTPWNRQG